MINMVDAVQEEIVEGMEHKHEEDEHAFDRTRVLSLRGSRRNWPRSIPTTVGLPRQGGGVDKMCDNLGVLMEALK
jgi:hypothetical protein